MRLATQTHRQQIKVGSPGLILVLLDQSQSMSLPFGIAESGAGTRTKAQVAATAVNRVIYEIQKASQSGRETRDRCFVGVITYGKDVTPVVGGWISEVARSFSGTEVHTVTLTDREGAPREAKQELPMWVRPEADNGTPMDRAMEQAYALAKDWVRKYGKCFPPVVLNITDGDPNDLQQGGDGTATAAAARRLMELESEDGDLLLFNAHISGERMDREISLPSSPPEGNRFAEFLFGISSVIPDTLVDRARREGFSPQADARGLVFNASPETLVRLLAFGSAPMLH